MNNNAFRDLVRSHGEKNSSKAIARKAVEDEFRKKKRKRSGDADSSSDEEEDDNKYKNKRKQKEEKEAEEDDSEAIQKDLSSRYRDRAKERREGRADETTTEEASNNNFLIVPHNIKGLDLAFARKERTALQSKSVGENQKPATAANAREDDAEGASKIRDKLPTLEQAHEILQAFLSKDKNKTTNDDYDEYNFPSTLSSGIVEYLGELFNWNTLDVSTWEAEGGAAGKSLQHTKFSLAIDGHPSDSLKGWQIPREYTLSRGGSSGGSSPALLSVDLMNKIDAVFSRKNLIRAKMMERQTPKSDQGRARITDTKETQITADKDGSSGDESDDDMFA